MVLVSNPERLSPSAATKPKTVLRYYIGRNGNKIQIYVRRQGEREIKKQGSKVRRRRKWKNKEGSKRWSWLATPKG